MKIDIQTDGGPLVLNIDGYEYHFNSLETPPDEPGEQPAETDNPMEGWPSSLKK